jgi:transcription initiation factor TFIIB
MSYLNNFEDLEKLTNADLKEIFEDIDFESHKTAKFEVNSRNNDTCPNCKSKNSLREDSIFGIIVCTNASCGQVIDNLIDNNLESRQFDDDGGKDQSRCNVAINRLLPQSSLGTDIGGSYRSRIKTLQRWGSMPYRERSLNLVFKEIHTKCMLLNMPKCIEDDAKIMYKSISDCKHTKGKDSGKFIIIRGANRRSMIAACLYFACRKKGITRSLKELSESFKLKYTEITRGCKNFLKLRKQKKMETKMGISLPEHYVMTFCQSLNIKKQFEEQAVKIARNMKRLNIASIHTPYSMASGCLLLMAELNNLAAYTKKNLALKFNVSEVTISKTYQEIEKYKNVLVDDILTDKLIKRHNEEAEDESIPDIVKQRMLKFAVNVTIVPEKDDNDNDSEYEFDGDNDSTFKNCNIDENIDEYHSDISIGLYSKLDDTTLSYNELFIMT